MEAGDPVLDGFCTPFIKLMLGSGKEGGCSRGWLPHRFLIPPQAMMPVGFIAVHELSSWIYQRCRKRKQIQQADVGEICSVFGHERRFGRGGPRIASGALVQQCSTTQRCGFAGQSKRSRADTLAATHPCLWQTSAEPVVGKIPTTEKPTTTCERRMARCVWRRSWYAATRGSISHPQRREAFVYLNHPFSQYKGPLIPLDSKQRRVLRHWATTMDNDGVQAL